MILKENLYLSH